MLNVELSLRNEELLNVECLVFSSKVRSLGV